MPDKRHHKNMCPVPDPSLGYSQGAADDCTALVVRGSREPGVLKDRATAFVKLAQYQVTVTAERCVVASQPDDSDEALHPDIDGSVCTVVPRNAPSRDEIQCGSTVSRSSNLLGLALTGSTGGL